MTLREDIVGLAGTKKVTDVESFLSTYTKDSLVFGEDTAGIYADVYGAIMGEDYSDLFESVDGVFNADILCEAGGMPDTVIKAIEDTKNAASGAHMLPGSSAHGLAGMPDTVRRAINSYSASQAFKGGFFSKIGNFLKGIKDGFVGTKVFEGLRNGLSWMISPQGLPIMAASAAGIGVVVAIVNALKKRGKTKEAEKLNAALEAAKKAKK